MIQRQWINSGVIHQLLAGVSASMGGFSFTVTNGWVTPVLPYLVGEESEIMMTPQEASWMISLSLTTNLISPIPGALLANYIGRKPVILLTAPIFAAGWIGIIYFKTYMALIIARLLQGVGMGISLSVTPVYLSEIASVEWRGAVTSLYYVFIWIGYLFVYCVGPFMTFSNYLSLSFAASLVFFPMFFIQPETPYFYLMKNDTSKAAKSLKWFRSVSELSFNQELETMIRNVEQEKVKKTSWKDVIASEADRKALNILLSANTLRILSGTHTILLYASEIFHTLSKLTIAPEYITITLGLVLVLGSSFGFMVVDLLGRRPLLIVSYVLSAMCFFTTSLFFYLQLEHNLDFSFLNLLPALAVFGSVGASVAGVYPVCSAYTELFISNTRSTAAGISATLTTFLAFLSVKSYQNFEDIFGIYFNFAIYSVICIVGAIVSFNYMPETKNKSFDQIRKELL